MRRKDREITDIQEIHNILASANVCRLAMCNCDRPYIVPMNYGFDTDRLYLHCASEGTKLELIRANPSVCFEVDVDVEVISGAKACDWTVRYRSVVGYGQARVVDNIMEKAQGLTILMRQFSNQAFEFPVETLHGVTVVRVDIESMTGKKAGF